MRRSRAHAALSQPDRQILLWVLAGLVAATISSGIIALATAMTMTSLT